MTHVYKTVDIKSANYCYFMNHCAISLIATDNNKYSILHKGDTPRTIYPI